MTNEKLELLRDAYEIVKSTLDLHDIDREEELKNKKLIRALGNLNHLFKNGEDQLYEDEDDIYVYCGHNTNRDKFFRGLSGKIVTTNNAEDYDKFIKNNTVLFLDLPFTPAFDHFTEHVYPQIRSDFQLEAFEKDNEEQAKVYIMKKYYKINDRKSIEKI